jgi:hypothetical protein
LIFHVEINLFRFPFFAEFGEEDAAQVQQGGFIGEAAGDAGTSMDFRFAPGHAAPKDGAFTIGPAAQGNQDGAVEYPAVLADVGAFIGLGLERVGAFLAMASSMRRPPPGPSSLKRGQA